MYRRLGEIDKAITYLEVARDTTPEANAAARRLEHIQNIKRYLHQQALKYGKAETELDKALHSPTEQWNLPLS